jgi:hypothetical protein
MNTVMIYMSSRCIMCYLNTLLVLLLIHCRYKFIDVMQTALQIHCVQGSDFSGFIKHDVETFPHNIDPNNTHLVYFVIFFLHD